MQAKDLEHYIDETEVSRIAGRAVSSLRNDRSLGKGIPYVKNGRSVRYSIKDVLEYMEARKVMTRN